MFSLNQIPCAVSFQGLTVIPGYTVCWPSQSKNREITQHCSPQSNFTLTSLSCWRCWGIWGRSEISSFFFLITAMPIGLFSHAQINGLLSTVFREGGMSSQELPISFSIFSLKVSWKIKIKQLLDMMQLQNGFSYFNPM